MRIEHMDRRGFLRLAGVTGAGLAVPNAIAACGSSGGAKNATAAVLKVSQPVDASTMDPQKQGSMTDMSVLQNMFDMLTHRDEQDRLVPGLATKWTATNPRTWRFELRKGVTFHNGEPFDAHVVKFSIDRLLAPRTKSPIVELRYVTGVKVIDDHTVDIVSSRPDPILPAKVSLFGGVMVPPRYLAKVGDNTFANKPVGTGAFKFVSWKRDNEIVMEANPKWWGGAPKIKQLVIRPMPDPSSSLAALQSGELQIVSGLTPDAAQQLGTSDAQLVRHAGVRTYYLALDTLSSGPLKDKRVRQALNYALDVDALTQALYSGYARRTATIVPEQAFGFDPSVKPYPHDLAKAKQLLSEAGYPHGFSTTLTGQNTDSDTVQAICGQLQKAGIKAKPNLIDPGTFEERLLANHANGLGPMYYIGNTGWTEDAESNLQSYVKPDRPQSRWHDAEASHLVDVEERSVDPQKRKQAFSRLQHIISEEAPFGFLYQVDNLYAMSKQVSWTPNSLGVLRMATATMKS